MRRATLCLAAAAAVAAAIPGALAAQGFQVNEHGTCVMARAGTGVASPCEDASAIYYNPAGMTALDGWTISAGVTVIAASGNFQADLTGATTDLANDPIPVPHLYAMYGKDKWSAGLGVFVPYGLGTKWPLDFEGRFLGYDNDLRSIYVQPSAAYQVTEWLSLGAGLDIVIASIELNQRLDFSAQQAPAPAPAGVTVGQLGIPFHTQFANAHIEAKGAKSIAGNFGLQLTPVPQLNIGVRYLTRTTLNYDGHATFDSVSTGVILPGGNAFGVPGGTPLDAVISGLGLFDAGGLLEDQGGGTSITMPDQLTVGLAFDVTPTLKLLGEWQWVHWSLFQVIELEFDNPLLNQTLHESYENTNGFRFGFDWLASGKVNLRGGYLHHQGAAPDQTVTPLLPEGSRNEFTGGVGIRFGEHWIVDLAYQYIRQDDRRGRVRDTSPGDPLPPTTALNSGLYTFNAHLFGATITARF